MPLDVGLDSRSEIISQLQRLPLEEALLSNLISDVHGIGVECLAPREPTQREDVNARHCPTIQRNIGSELNTRLEAGRLGEFEAVQRQQVAISFVELAPW